MKYSEAPQLTAGDLNGTELICVLDRNGATKTVTTATLKGLMPIAPGVGLLLANPKSTNGYRLADPTGEVPAPIPVETPTVNQWVGASTTSMFLSWTDNQVNPSDSFLISVSLTSGGTPIAGSPFRVTNTPIQSEYTVNGLQDGTSYTVTMLAEAGGDQSEATTPIAASTPIDTGTPGENAFSYVMDSEGGTLGAKADTNISGTMHYALNKTVFSDARVHTGGKAIEASLDAGSTGSSDWGIYYKWDGSAGQPYAKLTEGQEIWCRMYINQDGFSYPNGNAIKGFRYFTDKADGSNVQYINVYFHPSYLYVANWAAPLGTFYDNNGGFQSHPSGGPVFESPGAFSGWEALEVYVKASATQGILRCWRGGELFFEDTTSKTLQEVGGSLYAVSLWTHSSDVPASDQKTYVDDVKIVANQDPGGRDAADNWMIGT